MSSKNTTASAVEKTLEQQIDQLVAQFKADVLALLLNKVETNQVESKETEEKKLTNPVVDSIGTKRWYNAQGQLHRDELDDQGDVLSAMERQDGHKEWYVNGQLHREGDKPAIICFNGDKLWCINGKHHREGDNPSIIRVNGEQVWYVHGQRHRDNDKPALIYSNGDQEWWINNQYHREGDKPAIERSNGEKEWWIEGECVKKLLFKTA